MNRMNRLFRRGYVEAVGSVTLALLVFGVWRLMAGDGAGWLMAAVPWLLATGSIAISKLHVPRRARLTDWVWRVAAAVAVGAALALGGLGPVVVALAGLAAMGGYQLGYVRQHRPSGMLAVGEVLPDFPLTDQAGEEASSAVLRDGPHVILFYRGNWCPFCVAQVRALAEQYRELDRRGVQIALISPQPEADTLSLAAQFEVPMKFFADRDGAAAAALDIVQAGGVPLALSDGGNGDTVVPTVVITDADGKVVWLHHADDHRVRPEPTTYLEVIDREGIGAR